MAGDETQKPFLSLEVNIQDVRTKDNLKSAAIFSICFLVKAG